MSTAGATFVRPEEVGTPPPETRRALRPKYHGADRIFRAGARLSGATVLVIMSLIGVFLAYRASIAFQDAGFSFFTTQAWEPDSGNFGVAAIIVGTILIALVAIAIAVPLAIAVALYISEYAPKRLKGTFTSLVDLMAAVPSIVYGLWGFYLLQNNVTGLSRWISTYLGWIPLFDVKSADPNNPLTANSVYTSSTFIAGIVVAFMVAPIICAIMREVFSQAPAGEREGAFALGATRWGMIRTVVLPFGKGGMIGGTMLGLGRALGETIAIFIIISPTFVIQPHILENGTSSVASLIALKWSSASDLGLSALFAAGLTLFAMTLVINFGASTIVARSRSGAESDG